MKLDRRGDAGFMEAIVAFMAVTVVLAAYLGLVAASAVSTADPTQHLDAERFTGTMEDGTFVPGFEGYMGEFLDSTGNRGMTVVVRIPGGFCDPPDPVTLGTMDGPSWSRTLVSQIADDQGRAVPAVFEVTVCA